MSLILENIVISLNGQPLITDLSCRVDAGDVVSILGPSGCGKSSLLNMICGTLPSSFSYSGRIILNGKDVTSSPPHQRQIGLQFQDHLLFPHMTVGENLAFALPRHYRRAERAQRVEQALADCQLTGFARHNPAQLSGGQTARISLMRTLLSQPGALLLDEPFARLDATLRSNFRHFVFAQVRTLGIPALMVTHDEQDIPDRCQVIELSH